MSAPRTLLRLAWYWLPLLAYAAAIYYLSSLSRPPVPAWDFPHADKLLHLGEFAIFGALVCRALALGGEGLDPRLAATAAVLVGAVYGAADELHQALVPGRDSSLADLLVDAVGSAVGALFWWRVMLRRLGVGPKAGRGPAGPIG